MKDIVTRSFSSTGIVTRYAQSGCSDDVLLLIHGMGCSSLEWSENIPFLSARMTVIAVDLVGFGQSDKPSDFEYSSQSQARQLIALMDELGVQTFHIAGNSFGGRVAIEIEALLKVRVKSMTLVASAGGGLEAPLPMRISTLPFIGEALPIPSFEEFKKGWQTAFYDHNKLTETRVERKFLDSMRSGARRAHLLSLRSMMSMFGFKKADYLALDKKIRQINCPVLIVWGVNDIFLPVSHAHNFKSRIKDSKLILLEHCGHAPQIEKSYEFNQLLEEFLFF